MQQRCGPVPVRASGAWQGHTMRKMLLPIVGLAMAVDAIGARVGAADLPINPALTQATIGETVCVRGWTKTVRPPFLVTNAIKLAKLRERGLTAADRSRFELDHIIPLALSGAPADPRNLQLEPWDEAGDKDKVEGCLAHEICAGEIALEEAHRRIWRDGGDIIFRGAFVALLRRSIIYPTA